MIWLLLVASHAHAAETDYLPDNTQWNGLSELTNIARGMQIQLILLEELDWSNLPAGTSLLVIYPLRKLRAKHMITFLEGGGRLLLADDFGKGDHLLKALKIQHFDGHGLQSDRYHRSNPNLPVAKVGNAQHPLNAGLSEIITNHPAFFRSSYPTLIGFSAGRQLLVAVKVGKGRLVALSDPSVLINSMLQFPDNLTLSTNIIKYLHPKKNNQIFILTQQFRVKGSPQQNLSDEIPTGSFQRFLSDYSKFLGHANDFAFTKTTFRALPIIAGGIVLVSLVLILPLPRRPLRGHWLKPQGSIRWGISRHSNAGFKRVNAAYSAAVLREEVEDVLSKLLDAPGPVFTLHPKWVLGRVRELAGEEAAQACSEILTSMHHVSHLVSREQVELMKNIRQSDLATMYEQCRKLLESLGQNHLPAVSSPTTDHAKDR